MPRAQIRRKKASTGRSKKDKKRTYSEPIRKVGNFPGRNAPCPCNSGLKYKRCCGRTEGQRNAQFAGSPYKTLESQYTDEQRAAVQAFVRQWGFAPNPTQLMMYMEGDHDALLELILAGMEKIAAEPKFFAAVKKLQRLVTPKNQLLISDEDRAEWEAALQEGEECLSNSTDSSAKQLNLDTEPSSPTPSSSEES